jgi:hypothetical protein
MTSFMSEDTQKWIDEKCSARVGMVNVWECQACEHKLVVIHRHTGVTPVVLIHNASYGGAEDCSGQMVSWGYLNLTQLAYEPTHEFYRPDLSEYAKLESEPMKAHLRDGGLILRPLQQ